MTEIPTEVDVLVAGSGGGIAGAYTAAREGLSVLLVEATDMFGGTTAYSGGGGVWFPCNPVLQRAGTDDTIDAALNYFHAVVGDRTPRELQDAYVRGGAGLIEYLEQDPAFEFTVLPWPDYYGSAPDARNDGYRHTIPLPVPDSALGRYAGSVRGPLDTERLGVPAPEVLSGGRALVGRFLAALDRLPNVTCLRSTPLVELITEDGRVVGAVIEHEGAPIRVTTRRGVLLASGGFEQNPAMRAEYGVPGEANDTMGGPGSTGGAHRAGMAVGADVDLMDQAWWSPGLTHPDGRSAFALWFTGGIFVNQDGRRFVNESAPYDRLGREVIRQLQDGSAGLPFWMVYDNRDGNVPPVQATNVSMVDAAQYREAGLWHTADTVAGLAEAIGVPAAELEATIERFNKLAASGVDDDFGRGAEAYDRVFTAGESPLVPIDRPPYHAAAFGLSDLGTKGGLRTDTHARVLRADGTPIDGLYAAGNTMAAVSGTTYPGGGNPIGASMLFSHLAGLDMAAQDAAQ
ncbi:FAD-binding protein [Mycolicibacterium diernhoferi]|uniref:3-ketosteroid-delta-1-dehydrogenase n=1 Tax=Mycolicibacterium diernhoferi TaxID=1801 RepID=A0A1Q4H7B2_9MYCO|nr:FAD-binding protein [Mycolicibacterium diernhoferi]OJZ63440.1 3-ketosteroid-delta-1-dehydrogenase [Mycolicibacterium diernhoferi]OPE53714.1 3-ketosteroid-delta-1-dehydrogenase [Mycolicibacterium diernhoferi]PEG53980.1 3-ketosteroid-delta-1-dehydrogenase [Mycolicibacterium diernhoferi]QYL20581.1 FAD-binding protein [Mycolicibacterium diernhoferi]